MTDEHKGWTIYSGMYGTTEEILDRRHTYWSDAARKEGAFPGDWIIVGSHYRTRDEAVEAARQRIDEEAQ